MSEIMLSSFYEQKTPVKRIWWLRPCRAPELPAVISIRIRTVSRGKVVAFNRMSRVLPLCEGHVHRNGRSADTGPLQTHNNNTIVPSISFLLRQNSNSPQKHCLLLIKVNKSFSSSCWRELLLCAHRLRMKLSSKPVFCSQDLHR